MSDIQPTAQEPLAISIKDNNLAVEITYLVMTGLSLFGQLFTIATYRSIRNRSNRFYSYVAWHSVLGLPWAISSFLAVFFSKAKEDASCHITAYILTSSYTAYLMWSSVIAWAICSSLQGRKKLVGLQIKTVVATAVISFLLNGVAFLMNGYGPFDGNGISYCWYRDRLGGPIIIGYYIPLGFTFFFNCICYAWSLYIARNHASEETVKSFRSLLIFPLIQIICNSGWLLLRLERNIVNKLVGEPRFHLEFQILHVILARSQGFLEAAAYVFNESVRKEIRKAWCKKRNKQLLYQPNVFDEMNIENEVSERNEKSKRLQKTLMGDSESIVF